MQNKQKHMGLSTMLSRAKNKLHEHEGEAGMPSRYGDAFLRLFDSRIIFLNEDVTKETSSALSSLLLNYDNENPNEDITIYINSNGGDASALSNMYDVIQMISAPVSTVCIGKAYSAGAVLLASGAKGKRLAFKHSKIMIHGIQCVFPIMSDLDQIASKNYYDFLNKNNDSIMKMLADNCGKTLAQVREDCKKDVYLTASEALDYGLIDGIL
jgi:ATP-dependent Clp protease, protease subunit